MPFLCQTWSFCSQGSPCLFPLCVTVARWGQGLGDSLLLLGIARDHLFHLPAFRDRVFPSLPSPLPFLLPFLWDRGLLSMCLGLAWNSGSPCLTFSRAGMSGVPLHAGIFYVSSPLSLDVPATPVLLQLAASNHKSTYTSAPWIWACNPMSIRNILPSKQTDSDRGNVFRNVLEVSYLGR